MPENQISVGKRAYKLYNKVGATEQDKLQARVLVNSEKPEDLDIYGQFVRAEIIFWSRLSTASLYADALEIFQKIMLDKQLPKTLIVGASFFLGRMYELGLGASRNTEMAYAHYNMANKLNPKACLKDIARTQKALSDDTAKKQGYKNTPDKFRYCDSGEFGEIYEYYKNLDEWAKEYEKCQRALSDSRFFYPDDPDEVDVDLYCAVADDLNDD